MNDNMMLQLLSIILEQLEQDSEVAIFPYGKIGHRCYEILMDIGYLKGKTYLVDNMSDEIGVISFEQFINVANDPFIIIATNSLEFHNEYLPKIFSAGFSARRIGVVCKNNILSYEALRKVIQMPGDTLLDVGCGIGIHGKIFEDYGKEVTGLTMSREGMYNGQCLRNVIEGAYETCQLPQKYDIVWMSHVLEHIVDVRKALEKTRTDVLKNGGVLAITVPSNENNITISHIHTFNAGRVLRYLLYAGFDCSNAMVLEYGFNLSVILPEVKWLPDYLLVHESGSGHSPGDEGFNIVKELFNFLPGDVCVHEAWDGNLYFDGNISKLNWDLR